MLLIAPLLAALIAPQAAAENSSVLTPGLRDAVAKAGAAEHVSAYVVFADRPEYAAIGEAIASIPRRARGVELMHRLQQHDAAHRAPVVELLRRRETAGAAERVYDLALVNAVSFSATPAVIREIAAYPGIAYIAFDVPFENTADVGPPPAAPAQPPSAAAPPVVPQPSAHLVTQNVPACWNQGFDGTGVIVALLDDGTADTHPSLTNRIWTNPGEIPGNGIDDDHNGFVDDVRGWNFSSNNNSTFGTIHGTRTAGLLAGDGGLVDLGTGLAWITGGAKGAKLMLPTIAPTGALQTAAWAGYQYAIANGADLISSSQSWKWFVGAWPDYYLFRAATDAALAAGVLIINSSGNQGNDTVNFPVPFNVSAPANSPSPWAHPSQVQAGLSGALGVSAVNPDDSYYDLAAFGPAAWEDVKSYAPTYPYAENPAQYDYPYAHGASPGLLKPDVCAFTNVQTISGTNIYLTGFSGSSAATPQVAAAAAIMLQANPHLEPRHLAHLLQATAKDVYTAGKDVRFGAGRVQPYEALKRALVSVVADPQTPHLNTPVVFHAHTRAGRPTYLLFSMTQTPLPVPGVGTLDVNQPLVILNEIPSAPSSDFDFLTLGIPPEPALIGYKFWLQAVCDDTGGSTGAWLISSMESFTIGGW